MKNVIAVVVTYNRKALLKECIDSLLNQTYPNLKILVVDNASTDGTESLVKSEFNIDRVSYINTGANLGGAGGFQFGIKQAARMNDDYLWLMDDDSIPTKNALENLMQAADVVEDFGFLSSKVLWKDKTMCRMNIPKISLNHKLSEFDGKPKRIIMGTFVSFLVPTKVVKEIGLPIKEFFIWADDIEYSRRISRQYPCYFVPSSVIIHKCKSNNGSNIVNDVPERFQRYKYAYRNEVYVYKREGLPGWVHLFLKTNLHLVKVLANSKSMKRQRLAIIWHSTLSGLNFNPSIERLDD